MYVSDSTSNYTSNSENQSITNTHSNLIDDVLFYNAYND